MGLTNRQKKSFAFNVRHADEAREDLEGLSKRLVDACKQFCPLRFATGEQFTRVVHQIAGKVKCSRVDAEIALKEWITK